MPSSVPAVISSDTIASTIAMLARRAIVEQESETFCNCSIVSFSSFDCSACSDS